MEHFSIHPHKKAPTFQVRKSIIITKDESFVTKHPDFKNRIKKKKKKTARQQTVEPTWSDRVSKHRQVRPRPNQLPVNGLLLLGEQLLLLRRQPIR